VEIRRRKLVERERALMVVETQEVFVREENAPTATQDVVRFLRPTFPHVRKKGPGPHRRSGIALHRHHLQNIITPQGHHGYGSERILQNLPVLPH